MGSGQVGHLPFKVTLNTGRHSSFTPVGDIRYSGVLFQSLGTEVSYQRAGHTLLRPGVVEQFGGAGGIPHDIGSVSDTKSP